MGKFDKRKGDPLTAEEWNSLGGEIERLDRRIDEVSIEFPTSEEDKKKYLKGDKTWGNPQVPTMTVNPKVDIVPSSDAKVEVEEQTENSVKFKFSLPQGEEGKAYVPNVDDEGILTWELQDNPPEIETPVSIKGPQGEQGIGLTIEASKSSKTTTVIIRTDEDNPTTETLTIVDGADAVNPFKGLFALDENDKPDVPAGIEDNTVDGDYIYAPNSTDGSTTVIWKWNMTNSEWDETDIDVSDVVGVEFPNAKPVTQTNIINDLETGGIQDVLSAEQGKVLGVDIYGYDGEAIISADDYISEFSNSGRYLIADLKKTASTTESDSVLMFLPSSVKSKRVGYMTAIDFNTIKQHYNKLKIVGRSDGYAGWCMFVKKAVPTGVDYSYTELSAGGYLCDGMTFDNFITRIPPNGEDVTIDIPQDALTLYMSRKDAGNYNRIPSHVYPVYVPHTNGIKDDIRALELDTIGIQRNLDKINNAPYNFENIDIEDVLRKDVTNYCTAYFDADEISIQLTIDSMSVIVCNVVKNKNGTTDGNAGLLLGVKTVDIVWSPDDTFKNLTLRFTSSDNSDITLQQVIESITSCTISCKTDAKRYNIKANELELPITGLVQNSDGTQVVSDAIYTPEQFNFGGFRVVMPSYMNVEWYRGDNPDTFSRYSTIVNGDIALFVTKYSYNNIFQFKFQMEGVSRTILVDDVKDAIQQGKLKILYTPNDKHLSITERQTHCEPYLRALQTRLVNNFSSSTARKCYGTHDLPMLVHCTDVHNDIIRLSSAFEYSKYIQADALILTGDYCMRGATNGYGYIKELDDKWNPEGQNETQKIPYLVGTGNHDTWHATLAEMRSHLIDPFVNKHNYRLDANNRISGVAYYYVDLNIPYPRNGGYIYGNNTYQNTKSVRIIMLDLVDEQAGEISRWGISEEQIEWFIDTLNSTPSGTAIFVGLHTIPDEIIAPSGKQAEYAAEVPQTRTLQYVSDMFTYNDYLPYVTETLNGSYDFSGSPIVEIIDAFIGRTTGSGSYTYKVGGTSESMPQQSEITKSVNWSCDFTDAKGTFIAYMCGHYHVDLVSYIRNSQYTQLVLCNTCTVCEYGPYTNGRGSSSADCLRGSSGSTQDGFNVYVLDTLHKRIGIARIGSNMTNDLEPRTACWVSYTSS